MLVFELVGSQILQGCSLVSLYTPSFTEGLNCLHAIDLLASDQRLLIAPIRGRQVGRSPVMESSSGLEDLNRV